MKLIIHKGCVPKDTVVYYEPTIKGVIQMELFIKGIEIVAEKFLGHKDTKVFAHALASELIKHFFRKFDKDVSKEDFFRLIEIVLGKENLADKVKEILEVVADEKKD